MRISKLAKEFIPYKVVENKYKIYLDKNENPFDFPAPLKEKIFKELKNVQFNRYPPITAEPLREKIAESLGLKMENIIVGNGSDEILSLVPKLTEGDYNIINSPTFVMYRFYSKRNGIKVMDIPLDEQFDLRTSEIKRYADKARIIFICSPNNPTGNSLSRERIIDILETGACVVLDEAYIEFSDKESNIDLLNHYDNLIILRTFSKAFSMAGIRVGYGISNEKIISHLLALKAPFTVNALSMHIAEMMVENRDVIEEKIKFIKRERKRLLRKLKNYAFPGDANFILVNLPVYRFLLERGIVVRHFDEERIKNMVRITIGKKDENDTLLDALKEYLNEMDRV